MSTPINPEDQPQQQPQPQQPLPSQPQYAPPPQPQYAPPQQPQYAPPQQPQYAPPPQQPNYQVPPQYAAPQHTTQQPYPAAANYAHYAVPGVPGPGEPFDGAISPDDLTRPLYGATFGQAIRRFFKNYVNFSGRASRSEFWWVELFLFLVSLVPLLFYVIGISMLTVSTSSYDSSYGYSSSASAGTGAGALFLGLGLVLLVLIGLGTILPSLAITWRRLHDINFAGPFYFLTFVPYVGSLIVLIFTILSPKPEGRRFDRR